MFYEGNLFIILASKEVSHESSLDSNLQLHLINNDIKKIIEFFLPCFRFASSHLHHPMM
jgi:hypothetical protein